MLTKQGEDSGGPLSPKMSHQYICVQCDHVLDWCPCLPHGCKASYCTRAQSPNCPQVPICQCAEGHYFCLCSLTPFEKGTLVIEEPGVHWHRTHTHMTDLTATPERDPKAWAVQMQQKCPDLDEVFEFTSGIKPKGSV